MPSRRFPSACAALVGLLVVFSVCSAPCAAAPEDPQPGPGTKAGQPFRNEGLGVSAECPAGWKMIVDKTGAPTSWTRLATFNDAMTDGQAVLSARPRRAGTLDALLVEVRKDWDESRDRLSVSSLRKVEPAPGTSVGSVVVDGTFVRKEAPKPSKPGTPSPPPAPPVTYRVQATYYLGAGSEFLLYATGQQTHWGRLQGPLTALRDSVKLEGGPTKGPTGEGSYRDEANGFTCRFPRDYTVVVPQRGNHLVQFEGLAHTDVVLGVYAFPWTESVDRDAERLIAYYEQDLAGEATMKRTEVGGNEGMLVTAHARVGGQDKLFLLAIFKSGDTCFRVRGAMPAAAEVEGSLVFRQFTNSFKLAP